MKIKTAVFIGHRSCPDLDQRRVRHEIEKQIWDGTTRFLCGGMGQFDWICARCVASLKRDYPAVQSSLVIPYPSFSVLEPSYFDHILYPRELGQWDFKSVIPKRNQYLVDNASLAICYVNHDRGGAAKTYQYARQKSLKLINLGSLPTYSFRMV
nr:hypothetical protein [uncultured Solibaculum sp.]